MTGGQKGLVAAASALVLWAGVDMASGRILNAAIEARRELSRLEEAVVVTHTALVRSAPYWSLPAVASPVGVVVVWLIPWLRPRVRSGVSEERRVVASWLGWLASSAAAGVALAWAGHAAGVTPAAVWIWLIVSIPWSYAGALHRSFRLHRERSPSTDDWFLIWGSLGTALFPLGIVVPLWEFWRARTAAG